MLHKRPHDGAGVKPAAVGLEGWPRSPQAATPSAVALPGDSLLAKQWHLVRAGAGISLGGIWSEYAGRGVKVGVIDEGIQAAHPELASNYRADLDWDFVGRDADPSPSFAAEAHGTAVAGVIAAAANGSGTVGVAYEASLIGLRIGYGASGSLAQISGAFTQAAAVADVVNNSWGFSGFFGDNFSSPAFTALGAALEAAAMTGRGGLGTSIVFAAGNERAGGQNTNYHDFQNSPYVIAVGATDANGAVTSFSTPGATILVGAPGSGIVTTDRTGTDGYVAGDYVAVSGTSFASPIVSGIVALMLQANPRLGARDVQEILAYTAVDPTGSRPTGTNHADNWNGGGLTFNNDIGFGLVDAHAAVRLAESWTRQSTFANALHVTSAGMTTPVALADLGTTTSTQTIGAGRNFLADRVEVSIDLGHARLGDLVITLVSPEGTESVLLDRPGVVNGVTVVATPTGLTMQLGSAQFWGERPNGTWTLKVTDVAAGATGQLYGWQLDVIGDRGAKNTYVYTDAYGTLGADAARQVLVDPNRGVDTLNLSALTGAATVDLHTGATSMIAGRAMTIAPGTVIESAFGGDGNDVLIGNDVANRIAGGRGADTLTGGRGTDVFAYQRLADGGDRILDFTAQDSLGLGGLLKELGYAGRKPQADRWVSVMQDAGGAAVLLDPDGAGAATAIQIAYLEGYRAALTEAQLFG